MLYFRNDLYLTLEKGDFERGGKSTGKNIEVTILVLDSEGKVLEVCIVSVLCVCVCARACKRVIDWVTTGSGEYRCLIFLQLCEPFGSCAQIIKACNNDNSCSAMRLNLVVLKPKVGLLYHPQWSVWWLDGNSFPRQSKWKFSLEWNKLSNQSALLYWQCTTVYGPSLTLIVAAFYTQRMTVYGITVMLVTPACYSGVL